MNMHAPAPNKQRKRIAKLIRSLGCGACDNEIVAAAKSLESALKSAGASLHELADIFENGGKISQAEMRKLYDAGFEAGRADGIRAAEDAAHGPDEFRSIGPPSFNDMAIYCQRRIEKLGEAHAGFVDKMAAWTISREPSPKQATYLKSLFLQAGGGRK